MLSSCPVLVVVLYDSTQQGNGNGFRASDCKIAEANIFPLLYSSFTYSAFVDCFWSEIPGNAAFSAYPRGYVQNGISAPVILLCISSTACLSRMTPVNFFHLVFHFGHSLVFPGCFFCGYGPFIYYYSDIKFGIPLLKFTLGNHVGKL